MTEIYFFRKGAHFTFWKPIFTPNFSSFGLQIVEKIEKNHSKWPKMAKNGLKWPKSGPNNGRNFFFPKKVPPAIFENLPTHQISAHLAFK